VDRLGMTIVGMEEAEAEAEAFVEEVGVVHHLPNVVA
jgi:hypothetical protein